MNDDLMMVQILPLTRGDQSMSSLDELENGELKTTYVTAKSESFSEEKYLRFRWNSLYLLALDSAMLLLRFNFFNFFTLMSTALFLTFSLRKYTHLSSVLLLGMHFLGLYDTFDDILTRRIFDAHGKVNVFVFSTVLFFTYRWIGSVPLRGSGDVFVLFLTGLFSLSTRMFVNWDNISFEVIAMLFVILTLSLHSTYTIEQRTAEFVKLKGTHEHKISNDKSPKMDKLSFGIEQTIEIIEEDTENPIHAQYLSCSKGYFSLLDFCTDISKLEIGSKALQSKLVRNFDVSMLWANYVVEGDKFQLTKAISSLVLEVFSGTTPSTQIILNAEVTEVSDASLHFALNIKAINSNISRPRDGSESIRVALARLLIQTVNGSLRVMDGPLNTTCFSISITFRRQMPSSPQEKEVTEMTMVRDTHHITGQEVTYISRCMPLSDEKGLQYENMDKLCENFRSAKTSEISIVAAEADILSSVDNVSKLRKELGSNGIIVSVRGEGSSSHNIGAVFDAVAHGRVAGCSIDDIDAFLKGMDAIVSARVLASEDGFLEHVNSQLSEVAKSKSTNLRTTMDRPDWEEFAQLNGCNNADISIEEKEKYVRLVRECWATAVRRIIQEPSLQNIQVQAQAVKSSSIHLACNELKKSAENLEFAAIELQKHASRDLVEQARIRTLFEALFYRGLHLTV